MVVMRLGPAGSEGLPKNSAPNDGIHLIIRLFNSWMTRGFMIKDAKTIVELRVLVGYLGEQLRGWWQNLFPSPPAAAFLSWCSPVQSIKRERK